MKKIQILIIIFLVAGVLETKAQSQKVLPPPPPPLRVDNVKFKTPQITETAKPANMFYKRNPVVANLSWQGSDQITIKLKNGKQEKYDLRNGLQKKNFVDKYANPPIPPPTPPPPNI